MVSRVQRVLARFVGTAALACASIGAGAAWGQELAIKVAPPEFVVPRFSGPYSEREASIAPEEYERAERLKTLLDSGQTALVAKELEGFYDIELSPAMLALKGQVYAVLEMYDKAEKTYLSVLQRQPQLVRVHVDLAQLYLVQGKADQARQHFARAVALGSNDAMVHGQLGYLNLSQYGPFSAISSYQAAMAIEPDNRQWQQGLLAALTQAHMYDAARALLRELLAKRPNEPELWLNMAALALQQDDSAGALASVELAMLAGDNDRHNLVAAAKLHLQEGNFDRSIELFRKVASTGSVDFAAVGEAVAWLIQTGMLSKADELLTMVQPRVDGLGGDARSDYFLQRASLAHARGQLDQADTFFKRGLEANPANGKALVEYARLLVQQRRFVDAELIYMRAEAIQQVEKDALLGRAQLYVDMRDYPAALAQLRTVLLRYPEMRDLVENIEILENIIRTTPKSDSPDAGG